MIPASVLIAIVASAAALVAGAFYIIAGLLGKRIEELSSKSTESTQRLDDGFKQLSRDIADLRERTAAFEGRFVVIDKEIEAVASRFIAEYRITLHQGDEKHYRRLSELEHIFHDRTRNLEQFFTHHLVEALTIILRYTEAAHSATSEDKRAAAQRELKDAVSALNGELKRGTTEQSRVDIPDGDDDEDDDA